MEQGCGAGVWSRGVERGPGMASKFALSSCPAAPCRWHGVLNEPPSLLSLAMAFVARHLEHVESLEGLPDNVIETLCVIARQKRLLNDESVSRLVCGGPQTLDLSDCPISDKTLRHIASDEGEVHSTLEHLSLAGCQLITAKGLETLLKGVTSLQSLNISSCQKVVPEHVPQLLPRRLEPEGWEQDERWSGCGATLKTLVWKDVPADVAEILRQDLPWLSLDAVDDDAFMKLGATSSHEHFVASARDGALTIPALGPSPSSLCATSLPTEVRTIEAVDPCLWIAHHPAPDYSRPQQRAVAAPAPALHAAERMRLAFASSSTSPRSNCVADCWPVCRCPKRRHDQRGQLAEQRQRAGAVYLSASTVPGHDRALQRRLSYAARRARLPGGGGVLAVGPLGVRGADSGGGGGGGGGGAGSNV
eukprot:SAG11_NODE_4_length_33019_cov_28.098909_20_plen_419_part_00